MTHTTEVATGSTWNVLQAITPAQVQRVYSGRPGCACGCRGKYSTNPDHRAEASVERGYPIDADECSARNVVRVLRLLQADESTEIQDGYIIHAIIGGRQYIAYLCVAARGGAL